MSTFDGETITDTSGNVHHDTIDSNKTSFGLISLAGKDIASTKPFLGPYDSLKGSDVKLVHGDRWQQLEGYMTENVQKDFTTSIGQLGLWAPVSQSAQDSQLKMASSGDLPDDEQPDAPPTQEPQAGTGSYILTVGKDQKEIIGGDVNLTIGGTKNSVQIGPNFASFFSPYVHMGTGDHDWHWLADSYQILNNDYKIVLDCKSRTVGRKVDHANNVFSTATTVQSFVWVNKIAVLGSVVSATLIGLPMIGVVGSFKGIKGMIEPAHVGLQNDVKTGFHCALSTPFS